ncbi:MAG TPA: hypothetical protein VHV76_04930 [Mycobacteriales bacterium]|jgi:hypothetical protein|nr:hypothetical protein [Mycobacteriales bacterium]
MVAATEIPKAFTPPGGWHGEMPPDVLAGCTEPLAAGAPDLRGLWRSVDVTDNDGGSLPADHPIRDYVERIEQAGNRVVVTSAGIIHDMYADGTLENGVNDVLQSDYVTKISVAATFEDGVLVLRPDGFAGVEIRRWREGSQLRWRYHSLFTATLERVT